MSDTLDYENPTIPRPYAPTREQIGVLDDIREIGDMLSDATDIRISIETQLEFLDDGDEDLKSRRVSALIYWRVACKNLKNRINEINASRSREMRLPEARAA